MIDFNRPFLSGREEALFREVIQSGHFSGDGIFTRNCQDWLKAYTGAGKVLLTSSCTHALEMMAMLLDIQPGDEVIMPSFNFVSAANAFVLRGARIVFTDIRPDAMNVDERLIEKAISPRTKAIVVMHYGGVSCDMTTIMRLANEHGIAVLEDAAHGIGAFYQDRHLGTMGHAGAISFHHTKNIHCGEGGALLLNDPAWFDRAEILREKGTNRKAFHRGDVDKYTWVDYGSSYLPSEINAAFLWAQLPALETVNEQRRALWTEYYRQLQPLKAQGLIGLPHIPDHCRHNAHIFFLKCRDEAQRQGLIQFLKDRGISAAFHYIPLHSALAGQRFGRFHGEDQWTTRESERLLRLPLYPGLEQLPYIVDSILEFYRNI